MYLSARRPFSGAALFGWAAIHVCPALLVCYLIHNSKAAIYFPLIPLASVATWLVTIPFGLMTSRYREWVAGGPLGIVCSVLLCVTTFGRL